MNREGRPRTLRRAVRASIQVGRSQSIKMEITKADRESERVERTSRGMQALLSVGRMALQENKIK